MIHIQENSMMFNIPTSRFTIENIHKSYVYIGGIKKGNYINPVGSNSLSEDKVTSIKKSFAEAIERKSLMAGGYINSEGYITTFDLIQKKESQLDPKFTSYRVELPNVIDTTGMAAHTDSKIALQKALEELLEKNALFTFWYGKQGWRLKTETYDNHPIYQRIIREGYELMMFLNRQFCPLYTVIAVIYKDGSIISSGISASLYFNLALDAAINESYLLKWEKLVNYMKGKISITNNDYRYLNHLKSIEEIDNSFSKLKKENPINNYTDELINCIPEWVTNLHVIVLKNTTYKNFICIKVFSSDLYNHLPQKLFLDLNQTINKMTINIKKDEISKICDCIIR